MNIFVLDYDPFVAAEMHCDTHCSKMVLETAQLLSTAHHVIDVFPANEKKIYRPTHISHPCAVWIRQSSKNYIWAYQLFLGLCKEFHRRRLIQHKTSELLPYLVDAPKRIHIGSLTPFAQAMPDSCKHSDAVQAYRSYYLQHKRDIATWNWGRNPPYWWE